MSVTNGQLANQTTFNNAFVSRTQTTPASNSVTGIIKLANTTDPNSGAAFDNTQQYINEIADSDGTVGTSDATRKVYSSSNIVASGDSRKIAIGKIDAEFDAITGHNHDGSPGSGGPVSAATLTDFNNYLSQWQTFTISPAVGLDDDVSTQLTGKTPGGGVSTAGVITTGSYNKCELRVLSDETFIEDANGQRVYGRLTESASVWTLTYYTNEAGVETAHTLSSQNIRVYFREVFTMETRPTIQDDGGLIGSLDMTADIAEASATQKGLVTTGPQTIAGNKTFTGSVDVDVLNITNATAATIISTASDIYIVAVDGVSNDLEIDAKEIRLIAANDAIISGGGDIQLNATGDILCNSKQLKSVADPTANQDAATKIYVDDRTDQFFRERILGYTLLDNQATPVAIFGESTTGLSGIKMTYGIQRGSNSRHSDLWITTPDGTNTNYVDGTGVEYGSCGITFSADISGGQFRILYTSTNTGTNGTLNFEFTLIPA